MNSIKVINKPALLPRQKYGLCFKAIFLFLSALSCLFVLTAEELYAQNQTVMVLTTESLSPWELVADRINGDHTSEIVEAYNVTLTRDKNILKADYARLYRPTKWVFLKGNVFSNWNGDVIHAEEAEFDLVSQTGWMKKGNMFVAEPHIYFAGDYIRKTGGVTYTFENATLTACDGETPPWSVAAKQGNITLDGYAQLWSASFQIADQGVLYSPFMTVPVKQKRQSGLLTPEVSNSNKLGATVSLPIYWAIDAQNDMTFYETVMAKRGFMQGIEYRTTPDENTKGMWRLDYLYDKEINTGTTQYRRDNHNRYWLRGKFDGHLDEADKWRLKFDVDYVSDQDYLDEFDSGQYGFKRSREEFLREFGRDLADYATLLRQNAFRLTRDYDRFGLSFGADYYENSIVGHGNALTHSKDPTLQRLPEIQGYIFKERIVPETPVEFQMESSLVNFWRNYGTRGVRLSMRPKVTLPLHSNYITIIPGVGFTENIYNIPHYEDMPSGRSNLNRFIPEASISASSEISKVFELTPSTSSTATSEDSIKSNADNLDYALRSFDQNGTARKPQKPVTEWTAIKHSIQPRVNYLYTSIEKRDDIPDFDNNDNPAAISELTYSLRNTLDRRQETKSSFISVNYRTFARLQMEQSYDFKEASRSDDREKYPRRPFSDISTELLIYPDNYLYFSGKTWYSPYLDKLTKQTYGVNFILPNIGTATVAWDILSEVDEYKRPGRQAANLLRMGTTITAIPNWMLHYYTRVDFDLDKALEHDFELSYFHQCYYLSLSYEKREIEDRFSFNFTLVGLGI